MKTPRPHVIVLGAGYAGLNAALRLRIRVRNARITVVNERPFFVERIRNHQLAAGEQVRQRPIANILGKSTGFVQGTVTQLDPHDQTVSIQMAEGVSTLRYDLLIYALGSGLSRAGNAGAQHINDHEAAARLNHELRTSEYRAVDILGAGLSGIELAAELRENFPRLAITLVDRREPGYHLHPRARDYLRRTLDRMRIDYRSSEEQPAKISFDQTLKVNCTGFRSPALGRESGLACDNHDRILVGPDLRSRDFGNIIVAGDAAAYAFGLHKIPYSGCATAMPMGTQAGEVAADILNGKTPTAFRYGFTFQCIGLGRHDGIIQFLDKMSGEPTGRVLTGRKAALFKEFISILTVLLPRLEGLTRLPLYVWRKAMHE